ncbi:tryptophan transporter [Falsibacillus albus]|uniref:Tryptophan transporter n=1 Tax=Falsibacillus albus TaxID=2478915 RepID=A0A3L7K2P7_9BACI|nr:tryptophan transporter [Falsibacillus albus]RLQ97293.1 tryptophan transporter [Falsibacillus albus]
MKTKTLVALSLIVGIGAVLHTIIPGIVFGLKPDMMLSMMFLGILLFPEKKNVLLLGAVTGIISGLTSTFPGGFIPNVIDKLITSFTFFFVYTALVKKSNSIKAATALTSLGTILSGFIFLTSAYFIVGLPDSFVLLFGMGVLPAAVMNGIVMFIIYPVVQNILRRTQIAENI